MVKDGTTEISQTNSEALWTRARRLHFMISAMEKQRFLIKRQCGLIQFLKVSCTFFRGIEYRLQKNRL